MTLPATSSTSSGTDNDDNDEADGGTTSSKNERDSKSRSEKRLQSLLSKPCSETNNDDDDDGSSSLGATIPRWTVRKNRQAGDVLHIFSHIRKTYRVRWIVLDSPRIPAIAQVETSVKKTKNKGGADGKSHKWVKFEDVENAKYVQFIVSSFANFFFPASLYFYIFLSLYGYGMNY